MKCTKIGTVLAVVLFATYMGTGTTSAAPVGVSDVDAKAALADLSQVTGVTVQRWEQATALCNQDKYVETCAEIGKKHNLYKPEERRQVDALLVELKGKTIEALKNCSDEQCVVQVAGKLAASLTASAPSVARALDLTPEKVREKKVIVDVAKEAGVSVEQCRTMDPDTATVELLRACAKLAKDDRIQKYVPTQIKQQAEKSDASLVLRDRLAAGDYQCGDNTLEGCGTFCLNQSPNAQSQGVSAIPAVCRQIATEIFGPDGISQLEAAYGSVQQQTQAYDRQRRPQEPPLYPPGTSQTADRPCPDGQYRQESKDSFGAPRYGECIPITTPTTPPAQDARVAVCPARPTVATCPTGTARVATYSSPECGTYYTCRSLTESVRPPPTSIAGCAQYGDGWHSVDNAGNCLSPSLTEYRGPTGTVYTCAARPVFGCSETTNINANPLPLPPAPKPEWTNHEWIFKNGRHERSYILSGIKLPSEVTVDAYNQYVGGVTANVSNGYFAGWQPGGGDPNNWRAFGIPLVSASLVSRTDLPTTSPCPSQVGSLLSGCHWVYTDSSGDAIYCNGQETQSARLGDTDPKPGCSPPAMAERVPVDVIPVPPPKTDQTTPLPTGQREQAWNNQGLRSWVRTDADQNRIDSLKQACGSVPTSANVWLAGAGNSASVDFGMPDPAKCRAAATCTSGAYYNGSACVTTGPGYVNGGSTNCSTALIALLGNGCHQMYSDPSGNTVYCDGPMTKSAKDGDKVTTSGCTASGSGSTSGSDMGSGSGAGTGTGGTTYSGNTNWVSHTWRFKDGTSQNSQILKRTDAEYTAYIAGKDAETLTGYFAGWRPGAGNDTNWSDFGIPTISPTQTNYTSGGGGGGGAVSGSCSSELMGLLGSGCHNMGNAWFNSGMTSYVMPGTSAVVSCSSASISGCSGTSPYYGGGSYQSCPSGQYWDGSACRTSGSGSSTACNNNRSCEYGESAGSCPSDCGSGGSAPYSGSGPYQSCPSGQYWDSGQQICKDNSGACASAGGTWNTSSNYCQMPNSGSGSNGSSCSSNQYWNGSACVSSSGNTSGSSGSSYNNDAARAGCASAGGTWDTSSNYCQMPNSGSGSSGGSYDPAAAAAGCASAGGTWSGSTCVMPTTQSYFCPPHHLWDGQKCSLEASANTASVFQTLFRALFGD